MNFEALLTINGTGTALYDAIKTEAKDMPRSSITIQKRQKKLVIAVRAADATALRASMNTILKLLMVYEKMAAIK